MGSQLTASSNVAWIKRDAHLDTWAPGPVPAPGPHPVEHQDKWRNAVLLDVDTYVKMWGAFQTKRGSYTEDEKTHTLEVQNNAKQAANALLFGITKEGHSSPVRFIVALHTPWHGPCIRLPWLGLAVVDFSLGISTVWLRWGFAISHLYGSTAYMPTRTCGRVPGHVCGLSATL